MRPAPEVSDPALQAFLRDVEDAIAELTNPTKPRRLAGVAAAANLPPAADYPEQYIIVRDIRAIAVSTYSGSWGWRRADGGAL